MEVKEAIEWMRENNIILKYTEKSTSTNNRYVFVNVYNDAVNDIISLLQQGEKYRLMWEELDDFIGYSDYDILQKMKDIKQKHFPKEGFKTLSVEEEQMRGFLIAKLKKEVKQDYPESDE
uniref:Uncharacterized protein n=1 Tax=viral metagenome TaxID=1070528 RepID=A0A6M3IEW1_9ZZZZ